MSKQKSGFEGGKHSASPQSSGGFVPATYQSTTRKRDDSVGQPVVNGTLAQYSRTNSHYKSASSGPGKSKKAIVIAVIVVLAVAVAALGLYVFKEMEKKSFNADLQLDENEALEVEKELTQKDYTTFDEPFTVLLLGSDAREDDPDMGARTDTIILVRVDATTNTVSMVSIPRDTRIWIESAGSYEKFNAAYTFGGPSGTIAAVKELTGIDIDHYAEINFEGLVGLIDAIGGIDVYVDEEIDDEDAGGHIDQGEQHLDGEHALILARSRAYVDGDYTRQVNQRKVIMAIINKALTAPATELTGIIKASTKFLKTDKGIDFDFIKDLADQIRHNNDYEVKIYTATIPSGTATIDEVSWVIADTAGVEAMMKQFKKGKDVSKGVQVSSLEEDRAAAMATATNPNATYTGEGEVGVSYYDESQYYYDDSANYAADGGAGDGSQGYADDGQYYDDSGAADGGADEYYDDGGGGEYYDEA